MSDKQQRRTFAGELKVSIVKQHLVDGMSTLELCQKHRIQPGPASHPHPPSGAVGSPRDIR